MVLVIGVRRILVSVRFAIAIPIICVNVLVGLALKG